MTRENFKKIIKLRSEWKIDKKKGDYKLPNGKPLSHYIAHLVETQMEIDHLGIRENGDFCFMDGGEWNPELKKFDEYRLMPAFENNESCSRDEMESRIKYLVYEIIS